MSTFNYSTGAGRRRQFGLCPTQPFEETERMMSSDEAIYHLKKHRGGVTLHFYVGNDLFPNNEHVPVSAQFARDHVCSFIEQSATVCEFYVFDYDGMMHVTPLRTYPQNRQSRPVQTPKQPIQPTQGVQATSAAPNSEAPISALLTKTTQQQKLFQQFTTEDDPRGPFVDLTVTDPEYLACENFHQLFVDKMEDDSPDGPDEWFRTFANQAHNYACDGFWPKGWNPSWIATSDNFADDVLPKMLNDRLRGRLKEGRRIGFANLQPDALGIQLPIERGEAMETDEDDGELRFKGKIFKPYSKKAFDALEDDEQMEYIEVENQWRVLHGEHEKDNFFDD